MIFKNSLYIIDTLEHKNDIIYAKICIDVHHSIFSGHFPGHPVLPGACMLQVVKEVLEQAFNKPLKLTRAGMLKFLQLIDPQSVNTVYLNLKYKTDEFDQLQVSGTLFAGNVSYFKFQIVFTCC